MKKVIVIVLVILLTFTAIILFDLSDIRSRLKISELTDYLGIENNFKLKNVFIDEYEKTLTFVVNDDAKREKILKTVSEISQKTEEFLSENPDYFLNDYFITVEWDHMRLGEYFIVSNFAPALYEKEVYDSFVYLIYIRGDSFRLEDISRYFENIQYLDLLGAGGYDKSAFENFNNLKCLSFGYAIPEDMKSEILSAFPDCVIYDKNGWQRH